MFGGSKSRRLGALLCTVSIGAAAIAGCGGDEDEGNAKGPTGYSAAGEPPEMFLERLTKLLATARTAQDCRQLVPINSRSYVRFPCPAVKSLRRSMKSFKVVDTKEYGTGAVVDYKSGKVKDGAAIVLFVGTDRNWGISRFGIVTPPSTKTSDGENAESYEEAVGDYMTAVRERDCAAYKDAAFITPGTKPKDVCSKLFAATEELAARLKAYPDVEPRYEGGNAHYGFFSFETQRPEENSTISVIKNGNSAVVLDVAPSPTRRQQRALQKLAREQAKGGDEPEPEKSQSKKAD